MNKLKLSNIYHELWIASNAYIQMVTSITIDEIEKPKDEVHIGMLGDLYLYGNRYPSNTLTKTALIREYSKSMWIKVHNEFFEISGVHFTPNQANDEMLSNDKVGLIDEILTLSGERCDVYINASIQPTKIDI